MDERYKILLSESEMPQKWYNVQPDLLTPLPPSLKEDGTPIKPEDLEPIFSMELIKQEVSQERWIEIPDEVQDLLKIWRPTPLRRARRLEKALNTPARIYFKDESVSPAGSHKPNSSVAQAYYNKMEGITTLSTETGAGQWGSALAFASKLLGMKCRVYMVRVSYDQKPYRKLMMETWGADCYSSPTNMTESGRAVLKANPDSPGSLGIAISEAVEDAVKHDDVKYTLGSVLNHVCLHQTIIGQEVKKQLEIAGETADIVIGCVGGGSNFAGIAFPFVTDKIAGKDIKLLGVEPTACPTLTKGPYRYDFGDIAKLTPMMKMYTLGHDFVPAGIHAGGLRYHGAAPLLCSLVHDKVIEAVAYNQVDSFEAAMLFANTEGMIPAPETSHAILAAIREAEKCRETGEAKCIVFNYSGHGFFDLASYQAFFEGKLEKFEYSDEDLARSISKLPDIE